MPDPNTPKNPDPHVSNRSEDPSPLLPDHPPTHPNSDSDPSSSPSSDGHETSDMSDKNVELFKIDPDIHTEAGQDITIVPDHSLPISAADHSSIRPNFGGETFSYFFICKRKCWLHAHHIQLQHNSEAVALGKLLHELSFVRENRKEVEVDGAKIDFLDAGAIVHEIKSSRACEEVHIFQVQFYLYLLSLRGFPQLQGRIHYPKIKQTVEVLFSPEDAVWIQQQISLIQSLLANPTPPKAPYSSLCRKCSFEEFCWG